MIGNNTKAVGYLSAEFLMGKQLRNALLNSGLTEQFSRGEGTRFRPATVTDAEYEPGRAMVASAVWLRASSIRSPRWACRRSAMASSTATASSVKIR